MKKIFRQSKNPTRLELVAVMFFSIVFVVAFLGVLLLLPAGDLNWLNGWMLIASLVFYLLLVFIYFLVKDPATLVKRSKLSTEGGDFLILGLMGLIFLALHLLPAFDYRFGWSRLPLFVSWIGFAGRYYSGNFYPAHFSSAHPQRGKNAAARARWLSRIPTEGKIPTGSKAMVGIRQV